MLTRTLFGATWVVLSLLLLPLVGGWTPLAAQAPQSPVAETQTLEGNLEVLYEDSDRGSRLLHFLDTGAQRLPLRFQGAAPDLPSGSRVRVRGNPPPMARSRRPASPPSRCRRRGLSGSKTCWSS